VIGKVSSVTGASKGISVGIAKGVHSGGQRGERLPLRVGRAHFRSELAESDAEALREVA